MTLWSNSELRPRSSLFVLWLSENILVLVVNKLRCFCLRIFALSDLIKCGVPQGSILGPLFFILYINDLPRASKLTEPLLFADDTSIFFSNSNPNCLENVLSNELLNIDIWLKCDKLSINVQKTSHVIFRPSQRKVNHNFSLSFGGQPLTQSNVTKFLGVYLDEHLTWKYHINFVCKQIAKSVGILSRTRFYLSCKTKLMLYYTLIYPYITYCNSTWSSTYVSNFNRIYYLPKRAVRAVTNSDYRSHTAPLFSKLKILIRQLPNQYPRYW